MPDPTVLVDTIKITGWHRVVKFSDFIRAFGFMFFLALTRTDLRIQTCILGFYATWRGAGPTALSGDPACTGHVPKDRVHQKYHAMSDEEETELEQRDTELWDNSEYEASGSSMVTGAQLSGESHKCQGILVPFTPNRISSPGQLYQEKGRRMLNVLPV